MSHPVYPSSSAHYPGAMFEHAGAGFCIGMSCSSVWHFTKGVCRFAVGKAHLFEGLQAARIHAPRLGGRCATWFGLGMVMEHALINLRQKEDPWNSVISSAAAYFILNIRQGLPTASFLAISMAGLFSVSEGGFIMMENILPRRIGEQMMDPMKHNMLLSAGAAERIKEGK